MPELPDVESARRRAEHAIVGRRIVAVATRPDPIVFDGVSPRRFARVLRGRRVVAVRRKGKHLWMELDERPWPLFHFGMTGSFEIYRAPGERPRFWKVELLMEDETRLAMPDARRFGRIRLQHEPERELPVSGLGFDPLLGLPTASELRAALAGAPARRGGPPARAAARDREPGGGGGQRLGPLSKHLALPPPLGEGRGRAHRPA